MKLQAIAAKTVLSDEASVALALAELKHVPDSDLHFYLVLRDTLQQTAQETRKAITLAQMEWERRDLVQRKGLAFRTTILSAVLGILGVILGAILGHWLAEPTISGSTDRLDTAMADIAPETTDSGEDFSSTDQLRE